jgi:hypothetical protein
MTCASASRHKGVCSTAIVKSFGTKYWSIVASRAGRVFDSNRQDSHEKTHNDNSGFGVMVVMQVSIDGKAVVDVRSGERVTLYVPAGEHIFSAKMVGNPRKDVEVCVKPGAIRYYRLTMHSSGVTDLDPTLPDAE